MSKSNKSNFPLSPESHRIDRIATAIVNSKLCINGNWSYDKYSGQDYGIDFVLHYFTKEFASGYQVMCQQKGTSKIKNYRKETLSAFSFSLDTSTIRYGLNQGNSFLLFLVDVANQKIYFQSIQEYLINNSSELIKLNGSQKKLTIHIPFNNELPNKEELLSELCKKHYNYDIETNKITRL